jgi:hypothetical protein
MEQPRPAKPKPAKLTHQEKMIALGAGSFFVFFLIILIIAINMLPKNTNLSSSNTSSNTPAQPTTSQPTQTQTTPKPPSTAQQVADWYNKYGHTIATLANDLSQFVTDATKIDITASNTDCKQIQTDTTNAQSIPAILDPQSASDFSSSLTYLASMAQDCIDSTANYDASLITKADSELNQANSKLNATSTDIKALTKNQ